MDDFFKQYLRMLAASFGLFLFSWDHVLKNCFLFLLFLWNIFLILILEMIQCVSYSYLCELCSPTLEFCCRGSNERVTSNQSKGLICDQWDFIILRQRSTWNAEKKMSVKEIFLEGNPPWGFRMNGGADAGHPLRISRVSNF